MYLRVVIGVLTTLLLLLQVQLWVSADGFREVSRLSGLIRQQSAENSRLQDRNQRLEAEVVELRKGEGALEERARADLGLIGSDETFYIFGAPRPTG
jgi:cell division protein FtsB